MAARAARPQSNGQFLVPGKPERVRYAEPLRRRLRAVLGGDTVVESDDAGLLLEPGRYPVAYFPLADVAEGVLRPTDHRTRHADLGETAWFQVVAGPAVPLAAPGSTCALRDLVARRSTIARVDAAARRWVEHR